MAFGKDYVGQCSDSVRELRKHLPDIPVFVMTNRKKRPDFEGLPGVSFHLVIGAEDCENRSYRTRACSFSPFDRTLCMDTDTAIQSSKVMAGFDVLSSYDVALVPERTVSKSWVYELDEGVRRYYRAFDCFFNYEFPLVLYNGGVVFFRKGKGATAFFRVWHALWNEYGGGRDMPPLAKVAQLKVAKVKALSKKWNHPKGEIIRHGKGKISIPGIRTVPKLKPCITGKDGEKLKVEWKNVD